MNVVFVSRQLGHADPAITLRVYAHLFDGAEHAEHARDALDAALVRSWSSSGGNRSEDARASGTDVASLRDLQE